MASILALSWDRQGLSGIEFTAGSSLPQIHSGFSVPWPDQPPTATWLRQQLQSAGITAKQVAVAIPREDAVLRLMELPNVPDDELPTMVRFQAAARSSQPLEQLLLDFLPMPTRTGMPQKDVWLATTTQAIVSPIQTLLSECGLDLIHLTLSSLCLAELVTRAEFRQAMNQAATLIVLRTGSRMELVIASQHQLIAAHAVKWSSEQEPPPLNKQLAEVSRLLVQVQPWLPEASLQRAWIIGKSADLLPLKDAIQQRWSCLVEEFNIGKEFPSPQKLTGHLSDYSTAIGLAMLLSGPQTPRMDLLHPRQPAVKRDLRKPYLAAGAGAILLVSALFAAYITQSLAGISSKIDGLIIEDNRLGGKLKQGEPIFEAAKAMNEWQARNINQLQQMAELHHVMHGTQRVVISDYRFSQGTGTVLAKLKIVGNARDRSDSAELAQSLADLKKFKIRPSAATATTRDAEYVSRLDFEMDLVPPGVRATLPVKPPVAVTPPATKPKN